MSYILWPEFSKPDACREFWGLPRAKALSGPAFHFYEPFNYFICSTCFGGEGHSDTSSFEYKRFISNTTPALLFWKLLVMELTLLLWSNMALARTPTYFDVALLLVSSFHLSSSLSRVYDTGLIVATRPCKTLRKKWELKLQSSRVCLESHLPGKWTETCLIWNVLRRSWCKSSDFGFVFAEVTWLHPLCKAAFFLLLFSFSGFFVGSLEIMS